MAVKTTYHIPPAQQPAQLQPGEIASRITEIENNLKPHCFKMAKFYKPQADARKRGAKKSLAIWLQAIKEYSAELNTLYAQLDEITGFYQRP